MALIWLPMKTNFGKVRKDNKMLKEQKKIYQKHSVFAIA
jgi:hypothetical protein